MKPWALLFAGAAFLSACHRSTVVIQQPLRASASYTGVIPLSQVDLGASVLAEVENARAAIVSKDRVAATNDVAQALLFAVQLPDRPSRLIRPEPAHSGRHRVVGPDGTHLNHAALTDFGTLTELTSAQAELAGDYAAADAHLRNIQFGILQGLIPSDLPLLRAAASLDLARNDAATGRTTDLITQLLNAQSVLSSYSGPAHVVEAKALAATIGQTLSQPGTTDTMLPYQEGAWLTEVVQWAGADRWNGVSR